MWLVPGAAAGTRFLLHRLPEVFAGTSRDASPFRTRYLGANVPQAWAASLVSQLIRARLGVSADVENGVVNVDPFLPEWLTDLQIEGMPVGKQRINVLFRREENDETEATLTKADGIRLVRRPFAPVAYPGPIGRTA